jgi:hypothetical protein
MVFQSFKLAHAHVLVENYSKGMQFSISKGCDLDTEKYDYEIIKPHFKRKILIYKDGPMVCTFHQLRFFVEFIFFSLLFGFFTTWFALLVVTRKILTKFPNYFQEKQ